MNGKIMKAKGRKITINGQEFEFRLDMNAMCELDDIYDGDAVADIAKGKYKAARAIMYAGMKASLPDGTTLEEFGAMIGLLTVNAIISIIMNTVAENLDAGETDENTGE